MCMNHTTLLPAPSQYPSMLSLWVTAWTGLRYIVIDYVSHNLALEQSVSAGSEEIKNL